MRAESVYVGLWGSGIWMRRLYGCARSRGNHRRARRVFDEPAGIEEFSVILEVGDEAPHDEPFPAVPLQSVISNLLVEHGNGTAGTTGQEGGILFLDDLDPLEPRSQFHRSHFLKENVH